MFEATPQFSLVTDRGRYDLWVPAKGLVLQRLVGHGDAELMRTMTRELDKALAEASPISIFDDFEELEGYDSEGRLHLMAWTKENWAELRMVHILVRSRVVATGLSVANVAFGGAIRSHTERPRFEAAFKLELEQATVAPRKT